MPAKYFIFTSVSLLLLAALATTGAEKSSREKVLGYEKEWQDKYDQYNPDQDLLGVLKDAFGADVRVDVYLGLWCPDSRAHVPVFIRIMDELKLPSSARYYESPRKSGPDQKYYFEEVKVERVPTFIVYRGEKEVGRIVEHPQTTLLEDMIQILS
jgi:hypothetical protein